MKASEWVDRWKGRTVVCIASGPSLTAEDCALVQASALPTIVTNTTFRLCPWAEVLLAFDCKWWREYRGEVEKTFAGQRLACSQGALSFGVPVITRRETWFQAFGNSGTAAISLATIGGATRILLLGYDCQKTGGRTHWHGDHPPMLGNARSIRNWPTQFKNVARYAAGNGARVINCTRQTALTCFERFSLEEALG
jgi:hypothetical protein